MKESQSLSILEVKNLSHGFGDRAIFEDVSFRLLKESISVLSGPMVRGNRPS